MKLSSVSIVFISCLSAVCGLASAQQTPRAMQVITVQVRPGGNAGFEEYVAAVRTVSQRLGMDNYWLTAQSVSGSPTYTVAMEIDSWTALAELGPQPRMAEVLGAAEAKRLQSVIMEAVEGVHVAFYTPQPQLSMPRPAMESPPAAIVMFKIGINPNMGAQYAETAALTRAAAMAVAPDQHYLLMAPNFSADGVMIVSFVENWADMDGSRTGPAQAVLQHYGPATGAAITARVQETIASIETSLHRPRPDLSYQPEE